MLSKELRIGWFYKNIHTGTIYLINSISGSYISYWTIFPHYSNCKCPTSKFLDDFIFMPNINAWIDIL